MRNFFEKSNKVSIVNFLLMVIGLMPLFVIIVTGNPIFNNKLIAGVPYVDELIFYMGITLVFTSLTHSLIKNSISKKLIYCEILIVLSMYLGDVFLIFPSGSGTFVEMIRYSVILILTIPNFICFYTIYKFSGNIKISYLPSITGMITVLLHLTANEISIIIHRGFNTGSGIESFPRALFIIAFVTLMPPLLSATIIKIAEDLRNENTNSI